MKMFSKCTFLHIKIRGFKKEPKMCFDVHFCTFMFVYVHFFCWCCCFFVVFVVNLLLWMYKMCKNVHFENIFVHLDNIFKKMHITKHFLQKNNRRRNEADGSQQNVVEMCNPGWCNDEAKYIACESHALFIHLFISHSHINTDCMIKRRTGYDMNPQAIWSQSNKSCLDLLIALHVAHMPPFARGV